MMALAMLKNVSSDIMDIFDVTGFTDILTLDEDEFGELIKDLQKSFQELTQSAMQELR